MNKLNYKLKHIYDKDKEKARVFNWNSIKDFQEFMLLHDDSFNWKLLNVEKNNYDELDEEVHSLYAHVDKFLIKKQVKKIIKRFFAEGTNCKEFDKITSYEIEEENEKGN
jgi:hypothetical protein